ncbi:MAG: TrkA family potassium uptake protein [Chloroflexi bacterium]|nr:TrkA family potassium uptake protein [Chloroflexota bacterium]
MRVLIMGCGRVGARLASLLDGEGHEVIVLDVDPYAFRRLPAEFRGQAMVGNGIDVDVLRRAGIEQCEAFVACTQGDNRNVMAAQIAKHIFRVPRVVTRIYDPIREQTYRDLGLHTFCPTTFGADMMKQALERA